MSRILALDLGRSCGWATVVDGRINSGTQEFRSGRHSGAGVEFLQFRRWLTDLKCAVGGFDLVAYEEVRRHLGTDAAHVYGAFWGTLTAWCQQNEIPFQGVPVGTVKRHATGKGNASKWEMVLAAKARWQPGDRAMTDDEADALSILDYARQELAPREETT